MVAACDHPHVTSRDIDWLVAQRQPGTWAIVPMQSDASSCPTLALYEPQALDWLERKALEETHERFSLSRLLDHPRTKKLNVPPEFAKAWHDVDTPEQLRTFIGSTDSACPSTNVQAHQEER